MRSSYALLLLVTLLGSGVYFYSAFTPVCNVPMNYRLGDLDVRFNLTPAQAKEYLLQAEQVWETTVARDLFVYDESAPFPVNFIFDNRQERTIAEEAQRQTLDTKESSSAIISAEYTTLSAKYTDLKTVYEKDVATYEAKLERFNTKVAEYNAAGGAPESEFEALKKEEKSLATTADILQTRAVELAALVKSINELSDKGNQLIEQYNASVADYNTHFGRAHEFTQGDYQGKDINIYKFSSDAELVRVLTHEFGHALGLGHVEGTSSIMYYLMEKQPQFPALSTADQAALNAVCSARSEFINSVYRPLHAVVSLFIINR